MLSRRGNGRTPLTVLAFDFGLRRIGVATGDTVTGTAAPRAAIAARAAGPDWTAIEREIRSLQPRLLVVGSPRNADGTPSAMTAAAQAFARELHHRFSLPVAQVDERGSSLEAGAALKSRRASGERTRRVRKEHVDSAAAAIILERWFAGEHEP